MTGNLAKQTGARTRWLVPLFLLGLVLAVLIPAAPPWQELTSWDSGVFLYSGWQVTQGALPYRDFWDHKPPLIYWINALALTLGAGTRWGVWGLEVLSLSAAALIGFDLARRAFGVIAAVYASIAWLLNAFLVMDGGNYTTEYALPLQFASLWLVATAYDHPTSGRAYALGILGGVLFWLKQNDIGIPLAIGLYFALGILFARAKRAHTIALGMMAAGVVTVSIVAILPFAVNGALAQSWEAVFLYNFFYIQDTWQERLVVLRTTPRFLSGLGLMWFASAGWAVGAVTLANAVRPRAGVESRAGILVRWGEKLDALVRAREWRSAPAPLNRTQLIRLLSIMLIAFPLELALVTTSGNAFDHYFLALLPVFAGLGAFAFCTALGLWDRARLKPRVSTALAVVLVLAAAVLFAADAARIVRRLRVRMESYKGILEYIMVRTGAQDTVFIWQGEARVAFHVRREIATRFINPAPVRREGYATADKVLELLRDLEEHRPRFLFDAHVGTPAFFQFPVLTPEIEARRRELLSHYQERESVGSWTVYELHAP